LLVACGCSSKIKLKSNLHVYADYSETEQIHQRKNAAHGSLPTLLPDSLFSVKIEEMHEPMTGSNSPEGTLTPTRMSPVRRKDAYIVSGSDVEKTENADDAYESNKTEADINGKKNMCTVQIIREVHIEEAKENTCMVQVTKEDKGKASSWNFAYDAKAEGSNFLASIKDCLELFLKEEVVERRCEKCPEAPQQPSTSGSTLGNASVDSVIVKQKYDREHAVQKMTISKLPPVLTVQLKRFDKDKDDTSKQVKIKGHVTFEENLDVRQFMEPR
jgi:ubiquitin carboxyl-terminal hydrolase 16/45